MRLLESLYWVGSKLAGGAQINLHDVTVNQWEPYDTAPNCTVQQALEAILNYLQANRISKLVTRTQILIAPGYRFRIVNGLVTNFHQPGSTLLLLVAAFTGAGWRDIYDYAINHEYRFLSYGDGCLLWHDRGKSPA